MAKKKEKDVAKWKKKRWVPIVAGGMFNSQFLGETTVAEPSKVVGKPITVNLMNLTGESRNQHINMRFRVTGLKDNRALAEPVGYTISPSYIKRVVRRTQTRVDATMRIQTQDQKTIIIKPLMVTRNNVANSVATALRDQSGKLLQERVSQQSYESLLKDIIDSRLQVEIKRALSKVYPLKSWEVKDLRLA